MRVCHDVLHAVCVVTSLQPTPGKMAAVQDGPMELDAEKETKPEILSDGSSNLSGNTGSGSLSSSPLTAAPAGGAPKMEDQQTLIAVLQFLKRNKLSESVEILRREAGLAEDQEDSQAADGSGGGKSDGDGGDTNSLLSRVSIAAAAAPQSTMTAMPVKSEWHLQLLIDDIHHAPFELLKQQYKISFISCILSCIARVSHHQLPQQHIILQPSLYSLAYF